MNERGVVRVFQGHKVPHQIPLFQFRLRNGMSIGPNALKNIWSSASGSGDVTVSRELRRMGNQRSDHVYSLSGPANLLDLPSIETKLRHLLQTAMATAHIELTRLL
jgi:hypothetical protein